MLRQEDDKTERQQHRALDSALRREVKVQLTRTRRLGANLRSCVIVAPERSRCEQNRDKIDDTETNTKDRVSSFMKEDRRMEVTVITSLAKELNSLIAG